MADCSSNGKADVDPDEERPVEKSDKFCWRCQKEMTGLSTYKPEEMTSKDYYFDSYAHFGIHEVCIHIQFLFCGFYV